MTPTLAFVQRHDPDRYATLLFAPPSARQTLATLYAFNHELARAREVASQPLLALIRLQWWQEVLDGQTRAHPVAEALADALAAGRLRLPSLATMLDARRLEAEDPPDDAAWLGHLRGTGGALMDEAAWVLDPGADPARFVTVGAGVAAVGLLRNQRAHRAQGRVSVPPGRDLAWAARMAETLLGGPALWPRTQVVAALPVVLARRHLGRCGAAPPRPDPFARLALFAAAARRFF